ncbi:MAG: hypothetical protein M5U35_16630 [Roseovarius sp.]|nr:hypothetical protein [Roseovarius sp.]
MSAPGRIRLLACQIDVPAMTGADGRAAHLARTTRLVSDELARAPADLVVLPELSSIAYGGAAFAHLDALAEPLEGPSLAALVGGGAGAWRACRLWLRPARGRPPLHQHGGGGAGRRLSGNL